MREINNIHDREFEHIHRGGPKADGRRFTLDPILTQESNDLRETKRIHLVFHNPMIARIKSPLLEGEYEDRCMAYFSDKKDIKSKKAELVQVWKQLVKLNT